MAAGPQGDLVWTHAVESGHDCLSNPTFGKHFRKWSARIVIDDDLTISYCKNRLILGGCFSSEAGSVSERICWDWINCSSDGQLLLALSQIHLCITIRPPKRGDLFGLVLSTFIWPEALPAMILTLERYVILSETTHPSNKDPLLMLLLFSSM